MNSLTIIGNLTADPEHRTTQAGKEVTTFTVAVNRRGQDNAVDYFRVSAWGELGNNCNRYLTKGRKVAVCGPVSVSAYNGKDGKAHGNLEVMAQNVEFLSPKDQGNTEPPKHEAGYDEMPF